MNSISLLQVAQNVAGFINGQGGVLLAIIAIVIAGFKVAFSQGHHWSPIGAALGGCAVAFTAAWSVQTFFGAGGGP